MAYRIDYEKKHTLRRNLYYLFFSLIFLALGLMIRKRGAGPALNNLSGRLREGVPVAESLETFCREVFLEIS